MARRIQWISFLIVFLAISNCLATSSKNLKNNKSVKVNKKNSPSIAINSKRNNDFIFSDDEDRLSLMLGDQPIESSGDGSPDVDIVPETPENGSPEVDIAPETPENGSPDVAPETSENGSPDVAPETPENGNPDVVPENPEIGNPDVDPETPENIVVTSKPVVAITKKPHRPPVNASFPDNYIPAEV
jgi:pilus assembly protein FimV